MTAPNDNRTGTTVSARKTEAEVKLTPPGNGRIPVAFVISEDATVIDFAGPWEVFQDVMADARGEGTAFQLFTVSDRDGTITASSGMKLVPDYTLEMAPPAKIVVVPAQKGSRQIEEWLAGIAPDVDLIMSVCTGAFVLARAGLLNGRSATTHHLFTDKLAREFPQVTVKRGVRFVEDGRISSAGGLTAGIDLALRVVERYFGRAIALATADYMEYQGGGWKGSDP